MAKRIALFNHKGGVSKTTSAFNIGWMLAADHKVLLVDADPQCNLSGLVLDDRFDQYYTDAATAKQNIRDGVEAAFSGRPVPLAAVDCYRPPRAPNLHLLAGHANLSEYDAALSFAQMSNNALATLQNLPGAFSELIRLTEERYGIDYTLIDMNPGLSAINQNLFLVSDGFLLPTNPDPFSMMALDTLAKTLPRWAAWKTNAEALFAGSAYPLRPGTPKLVGTLIQRFNIRNGRAAKPYRDNIREIKRQTADVLLPALRRSGMVFSNEQYGAALLGNNLCLAEIPDFQGLLPKAHAAGVPVYALLDSEIRESGSVLEGMQAKRQMFSDIFQGICNHTIGLVEHA